MWEKVSYNNLYDIALYLYSKKRAQLEQCPCRCLAKKCNCGEYPASLLANITALGPDFAGMVEETAIRSKVH
jgi:hypothetical protein